MAVRFFRALSALALVCAGRGLAQAPTPVPTPTRTENVVVQAIRGDDEAPVTKTELGQPALAEKSWGQELPVLLADTPSVTQYSETGSGQGYAYFTLRGLSQTRVNMTFDGVPLNEPEDSAVYTADFGNLALNVASMQVQRGVGTSTFGAAAFAGSVNLESLDAARAPGLSVSLGGGSYGTARASADWNAGTFGGGWRLSLRPARLSDSTGRCSHWSPLGRPRSSGACTTSASPSATSISWTFRTTVLTSCTPIRCCSTSPIRWRR